MNRSRKRSGMNESKRDLFTFMYKHSQCESHIFLSHWLIYFHFFLKINWSTFLNMKNQSIWLTHVHTNPNHLCLKNLLMTLVRKYIARHTNYQAKLFFYMLNFVSLKWESKAYMHCNSSNSVYVPPDVNELMNWTYLGCPIFSRLFFYIFEVQSSYKCTHEEKTTTFQGEDSCMVLFAFDLHYLCIL